MLAVAGGKGGVGKTTTTLGVARSLGRRGEEVLVVDTDRGLPDLARTAGVDTVRTDVAALGTPPGRPVPDCPSVRLLTAPRDRGETRRLLATLTERPEHVILDGPAGAGRASTVPLRVADRSVVVSTLDPASLRDTAKTVAIARALGAPPMATALTGCADATDDVGRLLPSPLVPVPHVRAPLETERTRISYKELSTFATLRNG